MTLQQIDDYVDSREAAKFAGTCHGSLERATRQVFVMSCLSLRRARMRGWKLVGRSRDHQTRLNLGRSSSRKISWSERTNAGHDPTTTSFTELSAVRRFSARRFPRSDEESEETAKRGGGRGRGERRGTEKMHQSRIEGWTRWLMIWILAPTTTTTRARLRYFISIFMSRRILDSLKQFSSLFRFESPNSREKERESGRKLGKRNIPGHSETS